MPRITVSRVIGLIPLTWFCLVATWFFVPSPVVRQVDRDGTIQRGLRSGSTITTVARNGESFTAATHSGGLECNECSGIIFDWRLEGHTATDSLLLHIGETRVNLTEAALLGPSTEGSAKNQPYVTAPISTRVRTGGTDNPVIMPWFSWVDSVLIHHTLHSGYETINLRVFSPEHGVVQIWKDIAMWKTFSPEEPVRETDREVGLLASFSHVNTVYFAGASVRSNRATTEVSNMQGDLPTKTWPVRSIICGPLYVPTFMLSIIIWGLTLQTVPLSLIPFLGMLVILLAWLRAERVNLSPGWLCRERAKRTKRRGIWGASGPIPDEESGLLVSRPNKPFAMIPHAISKPSRSRAPVFDKF
ncbi:hypothetical protein BJ170DRAFT_164852 [Xylariales sp. AK1849]|nr:hypothetical protein BJ170DRAFT_164852 [Xylariales sp. AK1849]